jgi:hypothetical protein
MTEHNRDYTHIRLNTLSEKLIDAFIVYQHRLDQPMPLPTDTLATMQAKYRTDTLFHARVATLTAGVMHIVTDWLEQEAN